MTTLPITNLFVDEGAWPRDHMDASRVEMFVALLKEKEPLPPIEVVAVGDGTFVVADGVHRYQAAREAGLSNIDVQFVAPIAGENLLDCAFRRALETACLTALPLTKAERKRAAERLLATNSDLTHRAIARLVGVSHSTVDRWASGTADSASEYSSSILGPNADTVAIQLVRHLDRLRESRGLFDYFAPKGMGRHLAQAFYDRFGDESLSEARVYAAWVGRAVALLSGEEPW
jgi:ParB-like nuclease domain/Homeodomain-like domain